MKIRIFDKEQFGRDLIEEFIIENSYKKNDLKKLQRYANKCFCYDDLVKFIKRKFKVLENKTDCKAFCNITF